MVLEAFASYLGDLLAQAAHDELGKLLGVPGDIERMGKKLRYLKKFLADADRRNITDESVQEWVGELKRAMYEASDILDLCRLKAMEQGPSRIDHGCFNPLLFCLRNPLHAHEIGTRIKALNQKLDAIKEDSSMFSSTNLSSYEDRGSRVAPSTIRERETSWELDLSGLVGDKIEEDTKKLVEIMLTEKEDKNNESNKNFKVIAIVGVGGIGKTTLAQKVFNDEAIKSEFDMKIWLSVNKDSDKTELLRTAITHAEGDHRDGKSLAVLQPILTATLEGKKVLMVMDDVWNQITWEDVLKIPLVKAAPGSRVLITTRDQCVARGISAVLPYHHIDKLTPEDAWSLLKKQVVSSEMDEPDIDKLKDIGLKIIEKCDGLPLAIKVMGGLLKKREKRHRDWERVLEDSVWSISEMPEDLNSAIYLSYEDLPPHLKQCFLYCSLLPKSRYFHVNTIVAMWISEGFIHGNSNDLEESGTDYYKELISRNLIEPNKWSAGDNWHCSMHDIIRLFAQYVARNEAFIYHNGEIDISNKLTSQKFLRLSIGTEGWQSGELEWRSIQEQKSVRTLISVGQINMKPGDSLVNFSSLRTLHIGSTNIAALLDSLHQLKHLRYLALENTDISALPRNIGKMKLLQHIELAGSKNLVELPDGIVKLGHLRYLCLNDIANVDIPKGFGGLTNMRRLSGFRAHMNGDWCSLEELGPLSQLRLIGVEQLENVSTASSAAKANLGEKKHLTDMSLSCTSSLGDDGLVKEKEGVPEEEQRHIENVFDKLRPPPSVEHVVIRGFFGQRLPKWMMSTTGASFHKLMFLDMLDLACCTQLPDGLCQLPCLQHLEIRRAPSIKKVGPEFLGPSQGVVAFPKLNKMILEGMVEWEEWECEEEVQAFPHLDDLLLQGCKLRRVPPGLASNARAMKKLVVFRVQNLSYLKDFASLVVLEVYHNHDLERITGLDNLQKLTIVNCPEMKVLEGVPALQRLVLVDDVMDKLPGYINDVKPRHLLLECRLWLLTSVAAGEPDPEWKKLSHIENVKAYAHDGDNRQKWHVFYTRDPYSLESNISRPPEFEEALSSCMENDAQGFESVYKMRRNTFDYICSLVRDPCLEDMMSRNHTFDNGKVLSLQDRVAVALRMLNSGDTLETVGSSIGVNGPTISLVTEMFVKAMFERARNHLCWPDSGGMEKIKSKFDMLHGLPNCCGVIHTTHIALGLSEQNCDGEMNENILLQALVDTDDRFTNIWLGLSGSMNQLSLLHDSLLFKKCEKGAWLNGSKLKVSSDGSEVGEYIIGDAGYPLLPWLLTPYQEEDLSDSKVEFNRRHSKATAVMPRALERLKDTWKFEFLGRGTCGLRQLSHAIYACCRLHNIVIDKEKPRMPNYQMNYKWQVRRLADEDAVRARDMLSQHLTYSRPSESGGESGDEDDDDDSDGNNEEARGGSDSEQRDQEPEDKGEAGNEEATVDITKNGEEAAVTAPTTGRDDSVAVYSVEEAEDPEGLVNEGTLSFFEDEQGFESIFKMTRRTFRYVCSLVKVSSLEDMNSYTFVDGRVMCLEDRVAVALMLNSGEPPEIVGSSFGVNESTISLVTESFVEAIDERAGHHLRWPDSNEMEKIKSKFDKIHGLPNCCGVAHTTHIPFGPNSGHEKNGGVLTQAVIDPDMRFTDIWWGSADSMNQSSILHESYLFEKCEKGHLVNGSKLKVSLDGSEVGEYIIGDAGYPLLPWLLIPYQEDDPSDSKTEFNRRHSAATTCLALQALARLQDTWKCLHGVRWCSDDIGKLSEIIYLCCTLHNIVIEMEEEGTARDQEVNYSEQVRQLADEDAVRVRDILSQHLVESGVDTVDEEEEQETVPSDSGDEEKEQQEHTRTHKNRRGREAMLTRRSSSPLNLVFFFSATS